MSKGKFEAGRNDKAAKPVGRGDPYAVKTKPKKAKNQALGSKLWPILAAMAGVAVLVVGILIITGQKKANHNDFESTAPQGMPRAQLEQKAKDINSLLRRDLVLTMSPEQEPADPAAKDQPQSEEPIVITLPQADTGVALDLEKLSADLDDGKGKESGDSYVVDLRDYLSFREEDLKALADQLGREYGTEYAEAEIRLEAPTKEELPPESSSEPTEAEDEYAQPAEEPMMLVIRTPVVGRSLTAEQIYQAIYDSYRNAAGGQEPDKALQPSLSYELRMPAPLDLEELVKEYCTEPVNAELERATGDITPGKRGYGFDREALEKALEEAKPGDELRVLMQSIDPEVDTKTLRASLFQDVLAEAHTNHSAIWNRTNNLKLACEAIDGTILLPGDTFSFNKVVGERTAEKGYKEAIAYVNGGLSKPEVGGGVCQVASSIYYAVLQADLKTIEREPHMYLVDYVPSGMDTTIYWGYLDYKFENSSPYPIKIEASVHDGQVHIILRGTEWKDYTVELSYQVLSTTAWTTVEKEVPNDGTYYNGEVISTPYTGYKVATYKTTYDKQTGKKLETTEIAVSNYSKRDKVIAKVVSNPAPTEPAPTEPAPTEPKPTEPAPTEPAPTEPAPTEPAPTESQAPVDPGEPDPPVDSEPGEGGGD